MGKKFYQFFLIFCQVSEIIRLFDINQYYGNVRRNKRRTFCRERMDSSTIQKIGSTTNLMEATIENLYNSLIFNNLHVNACNININDLIY